MSQPLYEIKQELVSLQNLIDEAENPDETLIEAFRDTMEGIQLSFEEKAQNVVGFMNNVGANLDAIDNEIKRLQAKKKSIANKQEWFRDYLRTNMADAGISKIECPLFTISLGKPTVEVEVSDPELLPIDLREKVVTYKADKAAIKKALQAGEKVDGAELVDGKARLTIR